MTKRQKWYREVYLKSEHWQNKREEKLQHNPVCEMCGKKKGLQIHHLNYDNLENENISDLMTLCSKCHREAHGLGSIRRIRKNDIPFSKEGIVNRNSDITLAEIKVGIYIINEYYNYGNSDNILIDIDLINKYIYGDRHGGTDNIVKRSVVSLLTKIWLKDTLILDAKEIFLNVFKITINKNEFNNIVTNGEKDGKSIFFDCNIYGKQFNLTKHQVRIYELYSIWKGKSKTYPIGYEYIKDFFGVNYKNMGTFGIGVLNKAIQDLKDRNILDVEIEKQKASKKTKEKYNYVFKFKKLTGESNENRRI